MSVVPLLPEKGDSVIIRAITVYGGRVLIDHYECAELC